MLLDFLEAVFECEIVLVLLCQVWLTECLIDRGNFDIARGQSFPSMFLEYISQVGSSEVLKVRLYPMEVDGKQDGVNDRQREDRAVAEEIGGGDEAEGEGDHRLHGDVERGEAGGRPQVREGEDERNEERDAPLPF